mgnify:CR=1 FL=1
MISEFNKRLEDLDDLLDESLSLPFSSSKYIINGEKLRGIIDALRQSLPEELKRANSILEGKEKFVSKAKEEANIMTERAKKNAELMLSKAKATAETVVANAKAEQEALVDEQEIMLIATERAEKIIEQAKQDALKMRKVTLEYVDSILSQSMQAVRSANDDISRTNDAVAEALRQTAETATDAVKSSCGRTSDALNRAVAALDQARQAYANDNDTSDSEN